LYLDDSATIKFSTFDFSVVHSEPASFAPSTEDYKFGNGMFDHEDGFWAIRFYDAQGEDWLTKPIKSDASCAEVIGALNELPNDVIPKMSVDLCTRMAVTGKNPIVDTGSGTWSYYTDSYFNDNSHGFTSGLARPIKLPMGFWLYDNSNISSTVGLSLPDTKTTADFLLTGFVYRIHFFNNPGKLREPVIETYLDGDRRSIQSQVKNSGSLADNAPKGTVITKVWTDGQQGESHDYIADHCDGVTFTLTVNNGVTELDGLTDTEKALLKTCLGESDFDFGNNKEVYEWDYGSEDYPHLVKLVRRVTTYEDGGYYAALVWTGATGVPANKFVLWNPILPSDGQATDQYEIYTTKGVLARVSPYAKAYFGFASNEIFSTNITYDNERSHRDDPVGKKGGSFDGDISCELGIGRPNNGNKGVYDISAIYNASATGDILMSHCLSKEDLFTVLSYDNSGKNNPPHFNLYTAKKLFQKQYKYQVGHGGEGSFGIVRNNVKYEPVSFKTFTIRTDLSTNWANGQSNVNPFYFYKFYPDRESTYNYVAQCSNRGLCDESSGLCQCFAGYTGDSCHEQNSLSV